MLLNKKYKCPVCLEECITLKDRLQILNKGNINCCNCNARLGFAPMSHIITISIALLIITSIFLETNHNLAFIGLVLVIVYMVLLGELEDYGPVKPKFNLNEFLDDLKNQNSKG